VNKGGIHRVVAGTKRGRQVVAGNAFVSDARYVVISTEIEAWNKAVDAKRAAKLKAKVTFTVVPHD